MVLPFFVPYEYKKMPMVYCTYILYSETLDKYYIGYTNDIRRRIEEHNRPKGKFTDKGIPWKIVHTEDFESAQLAYQRELEVKGKKSRKYIEWILSKK